jgi:hypothetical protein
MTRKIVVLKKEERRPSANEPGQDHDVMLGTALSALTSHTKMTEIRKTESIQKVSPWKALYYLRSWPFIRHFLRAVGMNRQGTAITR